MYELFTKCLRVIPLLVAFCLLVTSVPALASNEPQGLQSETRVVTTNFEDLDGNVVGTKTKEITISAPVYNEEGTKSITMTELISYSLNEDYEFKDKLQASTRVTVFSTDIYGNNYINNELVNIDLTPDNGQFTTFDSGGHWKYTYYNCDSSTQCYLYTGSGTTFNLETVHDAYKERYLIKNTTNNSTISDFKLYATQVKNAHDDYWAAGVEYNLAIIAGLATIPFANALALAAAGGLVIFFAYQGYSAWQDMNDAMANAYSLL